MNLSPAYLEWKEQTRQEGIQLGEQRGIQLGKQEVARNLLNLGTDPSVVSQATGLSLEQVLALPQHSGQNGLDS